MKRRVSSGAADGRLFQLAMLAVATGLVAGLGTVGYEALIGLFHNLFFFGRLDWRYDPAIHTPPSPLGPLVILVPVAGALVVAFLVKHFAPEAKGPGVSEVIYAVYYRRGVIRPAVALLKALVSSISIGSGGSVGREGPIVQIGASFGSTLGQFLRVPDWHRVTLIACGAGAGIAATFNAPLGGILFAIEVIMPEISARTLLPLTLATGVATVVSRVLLSDHPVFLVRHATLTAVHLASFELLALYAAFGVLLGLASLLFIRLLYRVEALFERLPGNAYSRHALGMLVVGLMLYLVMTGFGHYYVDGVGFAAVQDVLGYALGDPRLLLLLFALKLLATALTLGSGGSGGIFSPSLFIGAMLGAGCAALANPLLPPGLRLDPAGMAIGGMAGMLAGTTGAMVAAVVMTFELTRDYGSVMPLLIIGAVSYGVRRLFLVDSAYTLKLTLRGHHIPETLRSNLALLQPVAALAAAPVVRLDVGEWAGPFLAPDCSPLVPHVLLTERGRLRAMVPAEHMAASLKTPEAALPPGSNFVVAAAEEMANDVLARMRAADADAVLLTRNGRLERAEDVVAVVTLGDFVKAGHLAPEQADQMTGQQARSVS